MQRCVVSSRNRKDGSYTIRLIGFNVFWVSNFWTWWRRCQGSVFTSNFTVASLTFTIESFRIPKKTNVNGMKCFVCQSITFRWDGFTVTSGFLSMVGEFDLWFRTAFGACVPLWAGPRSCCASFWVWRVWFRRIVSVNVYRWVTAAYCDVIEIKQGLLSTRAVAGIVV